MALSLAGASLALPATDAGAAPKLISGKLSKPRYTVIAVGMSGQTAVRAGRGAFKLAPRVGGSGVGQGVSLHLRAPNGTYAGPIVLDDGQRARKQVRKAKRKVKRAKRNVKRATKAGKGLAKARNELRKAKRHLKRAKRRLRRALRRVVLGVRPGARLGRIRVRRGYATLTRRPRGKWVDSSLVARARRGVPIGARLFGRVRSRPPRNPVPGDFDLDGVPEPLDIDDDGDLILDDFDRSAPVRLAPRQGARAAQQVLEDPMFHNSLELSLSGTVNVNAGSTDRQIEQTFLGLLIIGRSQAPFTELDCGRDDLATPQQEGLSYCRPGGNGKILPAPGQPLTAFPGCCDSDGDGFGTLVTTVAPPFLGGGSTFFTLRYEATTAEIKAGQVLIKRANDASGNELATFSKTLQYVFATVPALISYDDGAGQSGSLSYPVAEGQPPPGSPGGLGTKRNAFPVSPRPIGDPAAGRVVVSLTLWQPQRRPVPGEPGHSEPPSAWIDIGRLTYSATIETPDDPQTGRFSYKRCPQDAYSGGPPFSLPPPGAGPGLTESLPDRPANPNNRLSYTLDLTKCLAGTPWNAGETVGVQLSASGLRQPPSPAAGSAIQNAVYFKLQ